jgi:hypothetical protein
VANVVGDVVPLVQFVSTLILPADTVVHVVAYNVLVPVSSSSTKQYFIAHKNWEKVDFFI